MTPRAHIFRRSLTDTIEYIVSKPFLPYVDLRNVKPVRPTEEREIVGIVVVRNELSRLPPLLAHYRWLGVTRFAIVDDKSTDGTSDFLLKQPDVDVFQSSKNYSEAERGNRWFQQMPRFYGRGRWYLLVDSDEYLVYDGMEDHRLPELARWLNGQGKKRLLAPMIDLYPQGDINEVSFDPARPPWEIADHFDSTGYTWTSTPQNIKVRGGPRSRLFGTHTLTKYPLFFWDHLAIYHKSIHAPLPYWRNHDVALGNLLHFKLFDDFTQRAEVAVSEDQHWNHAAKYKRYYETTKNMKSFSVIDQSSKKYNGTSDLLKAGLLHRIDWEAR